MVDDGLRVAHVLRGGVLLQAAAARLNVSIDELSTEPSMVVHTATQKKIAYGDQNLTPYEGM